MNKVILLCNLTRNPELSYTPANVPVVDFGVACNKKWKGQDGQMHEEATFVDCRAFKHTAENISKYFQKGSKILIEGELHFSSWEDKKTGGKRSKLSVTVYQWDFVDSKSEQQAPQQQQAPAPQPQNDPSSSDIPF